MTAQEQQMLQGLVDRVNQTQLTEKDPDAERFIQQTLGKNPDAEYILAQTVLVQGYALEQAQKQIADLRGQLDQARQPKHTTSFLGNLLGHKDEPARTAPPPPPPPPPQQMAPPVEYTSVPMYAPAGGYPIAGAPQGGGFLRSAAQTAAGVAAGALAFEGVESLLHGFGHSAGYGPEFGTTAFEGIGGGRPEEVINNYYGDSSPQEHEHGTGANDQLFTDHPTGEAHSASDSGDGAKFEDASYQTGGNPDDAGVGLNDTSDYSTDADDSTLSDDVGDGQDDSGFDSGGDDSGSGDFGGDDGSSGF